MDDDDFENMLFILFILVTVLAGVVAFGTLFTQLG